MAEPPYGIIASKLKTGNVIPFLGAGASLGKRNPPKARFDPASPRFVPKAAELAAVLAKESSFPSENVNDRSDLAKVSSYYAGVSSDRRTLRSRLRELLHPVTDALAAESKEKKPLTIHRLLAAMPSHQVIVTTNYDALIENAFDEVNKPYDVVIYPADRLAEYVNSVLWWPYGQTPQPVESNKLDLHLDLLSKSKTVIFKMHGTRHPSDQNYDHFVVTEEDYVEFLSRMAQQSAIPTIFFPYFRERSFLFLGYGLRDWNLRVLLNNLPRHTDDQLRSWAIQTKPSELETALWGKREVSIYDLTLDKFVHQIARELGGL
jgi:hypothetical protein